MPIKLGNKNISTIYKGTTPISAIYKGTTLLYQSASWELYSKVYFYNELVPTTINGKNVLNKAKIVKISGNGVIENQLVQNGDFSNGTSGWIMEQGGTLTYGNNKLIVSTNGNNQVWFYQANHSVIANHKYLCVITAKATMNCSFWFTIPYYSYVAHQLVANQKLLVSEIIIPNISYSGNIAIRFNTGTNVSGETIEFENFMVIDLTLMFGTGNEPTTLTDNRIQNILNRGYIPYNLGEYKGTDIGVVSTTKADTTALDTITFKAQLNGAINSHDTMKITKTDYVFTKAHKTIDMGSLTYTRYETDGVYRFSATITDIYKPQTYDERKENCACSKYAACQSVSYGFMENKGWIHLSTLVCFRDDSYTNETDFKNAVTGATFTYKLATPQVITIPRKYMGVVDLGSLNWGTPNSIGRVGAEDIQSTVKKPSVNNIQANIYCANYLSKTADQTYVGNIGISIQTNGTVHICDSSFIGLTNSQIQAKLSGIYLFYETENEVADIENVVDIESGGTITTDSEVLPNVDLLIKAK